MTAPDTPRHKFVIDPIHQAPTEEPEVAQTLAHLCQAIGLELPPMPPSVVGWRLTLTIDGQLAEQHEFDGVQEGFQNAQHAARAWLAQHGTDSIGQWLAGSFQAFRRMNWDHDYQHAIRRRGF